MKMSTTFIYPDSPTTETAELKTLYSQEVKTEKCKYTFTKGVHGEHDKFQFLSFNINMLFCALSGLGLQGILIWQMC